MTLVLQAARLCGKAVAVIATATALSGCGAFSNGSSLATNYPIAVSPQPFVLEVPVADKLSDQESNRVAAFARRYREIGEGHITIAYPGESVSDLYVAEIAAQTQMQGVHPSRIATGVYAPEGDRDRGVVLSFYAGDALVKPCPDRWSPSAPNMSNTNHERFGCANQHNLAAMLSRPRDYQEPRASSPADLARRSTLLNSYRAGQATQAEGSGSNVSTTQ